MILFAYRSWESDQQNDGEMNDMPKTVQWLLAHEHYTLFLYYARRQPHVLTEMVKRGILRNASFHDRLRFIELINQQVNGSGETLAYVLVCASENGCNNSVASLLRAAFNVDTEVHGRTALHAAAKGGHLGIVKRLLAAKADVNAITNVRALAKYGLGTAPQAAAKAGHLEIVERLLAAKTDVNIQSRLGGRTVLEAAADGGHLEIVERLRQAGAG